MSRTSELLNVPGVAAATLFSRKGHLEEREGALTDAEASEMANLCAAITMTMEMQGRMLARMSDHPAWQSGFGWLMWGPEMSIVAVHDSACVVRARDAAFNQLIEAMTASANAEIVKPAKGEPHASTG